MCRFVAYKGEEILMADLLLRAKHSLVKQSYHARERDEPLNGDGFGVGWYTSHEDPIPCFFTSITPAWSNNNLHRLSEKIRSSSFLAHVRAATSGLLVNEANCHPFQHKQFLWMHNGMIGNFSKIKRQMRESLSDEFYDIIQGTTDSEHAFALFLDNLCEDRESPSLDAMIRAMQKTIEQINALSPATGKDNMTFLNLVVTDGEKIVATRYVNSNMATPMSLYFTCGSTFELYEGDFRMKRDEHGPQTVIISSEPLTEIREDWMAVEPNHMITVDSGSKIGMVPIEAG